MQKLIFSPLEVTLAAYFREPVEKVTLSQLRIGFALKLEYFRIQE